LPCFFHGRGGRQGGGGGNGKKTDKGFGGFGKRCEGKGGDEGDPSSQGKGAVRGGGKEGDHQEGLLRGAGLGKTLSGSLGNLACSFTKKERGFPKEGVRGMYRGETVPQKGKNIILRGFLLSIQGVLLLPLGKGGVIEKMGLGAVRRHRGEKSRGAGIYPSYSGGDGC